MFDGCKAPLSSSHLFTTVNHLCTYVWQMFLVPFVQSIFYIYLWGGESKLHNKLHWILRKPLNIYMQIHSPMALPYLYLVCQKNTNISHSLLLEEMDILGIFSTKSCDSDCDNKASPQSLVSIPLQPYACIQSGWKELIFHIQSSPKPFKGPLACRYHPLIISPLNFQIFFFQTFMLFILSANSYPIDVCFLTVISTQLSILELCIYR